MKQYIDRNALLEELRNDLENDVNIYCHHFEKEYRDAQYEFAIERIEEAPIIEEETCECFETTFKDEYWGYWIKCKCGSSSPKYSKYCTGCGKKIKIIGVRDYYFGIEDEEAK